MIIPVVPPIVETPFQIFLDDPWKWFLGNGDMTALGALLGFLTVVATFYKQVGIPMYNATIAPVARFFFNIYDAPARINQLDSKLDLILGEFKTNSGTSMKDQLNRLEDQVSLSEAQRLLILDSQPNGIWVSDANGLCTWCNASLRQKVNGVREDIYGDNWINIIYPVDRRGVKEEWDSAVKAGRDFNLHYRLVNLKTQEPIQVHGIATPAKDFSGDIIGYNGVAYFLEAKGESTSVPM